MIRLDSMPPLIRRPKKPRKVKDPERLRVPHLRVLRVLYKSAGPLCRRIISQRTGNATEVMVGRAIGYSDPKKRASFLLTKDGITAGLSLLDRGFVQEIEIDIDGLKELGVEITELGRLAYEEYLPLIQSGQIPLDVITNPHNIRRRRLCFMPPPGRIPTELHHRNADLWCAEYSKMPLEELIERLIKMKIPRLMPTINKLRNLLD